MEEPLARPLVFALNGQRVELGHVEPSMTLLTYIRTYTKFKGTKLGCGEGGCGACVVLVSKYDAATKQVEHLTINSCLALLSSVDQTAVTTIEGLGSSRSGLHAVQKRFTGFHASQCGFCTPGMCMSVYGALKQYGAHPLQSSLDIEKTLSGNLCRCTGYRPIADVCKSFVEAADIEDLGLNSFWNKKQEARLQHLPAYDSNKDPKFPEFLIEEIEQSVGSVKQIYSPSQTLFRPSSLRGTVSKLESFGDRKHEVKIVVGNTSTGVYSDWDHKVFLDVSRIPELQKTDSHRNGVEVGAAVSISKLITVLKSWISTYVNDDERAGHVYEAVISHLNKIASHHVRNAASIGGNLVMAQKFEFDSDLATVLLGIGATVKVVSQASMEETIQSMDEFLAGPLDSSPTLVKSVFIPSYYGVGKAMKDGTPEPVILFKTYRASPRPSLGNAVSYCNAAFLVKISGMSGTIEEARLAFGAFGHKHAVRTTEVEQFLKGKIASGETLLGAIPLLRNHVRPGTLRRTKSCYREALAVSFLFKFFNAPISSEAPVSRSFITGNQKLAGEDNRHALGKPSEKDMAYLQASGEAVYVDDMPSPDDCLHAAFVYSRKALAKINGIDATNALALPGAVSLYTVKDIPELGANIGVSSDLINEALFAEETVQCFGQAVGIMVADTRKNALAAAKLVEVDYDTEALGKPILTVEDAVAKSSYFPVPPQFETSTFGDVSEGFLKAEHEVAGEVRTPTQYYFYMEMNAVLVIPEEDNCLTIYSSCQAPEFVQQTVSACVGLPMHNIRVITKRVGGGFGGKAAKACIVAAACALAALKLGRPVRMYLDRKTDMVMMGGRELTKAVYKVGFSSDGKISALEALVYVHAGWSVDMMWMLPLIMESTLKKFNWGSFKLDFKVCKTNLPSKTAMRGPGDAAASFIADAIIEHVAAALGTDSQMIMEKNMHSLESAEAFYGRHVGGSTGFTLPLVWEQLKRTADYEKRMGQVQKFNRENMWIKRGLSMVQCTYAIRLYTKPGRVSIFSDNSVVLEVGGVELGQGLWTKVKQAAAYTLSKLFDNDEEKIPVSKFRVVQTDSISLISGGWTAGSSASEGSCEAVRRSCDTLVERLMPIKRKLQETAGSVSWESLITAAKVAAVDTSAQYYFAPAPEDMTYLVYGAGISEVEIDVLTGETTVLRSDLLYDSGKSMNPAVDLGQIEGSFVQGIGFMVTEEHVVDDEGKIVSDGTWTYKPPTIDNVPRVLNVEFMNSPAHKDRILSSKASGEPPLLLASSVHGAIRHAIAASRANAAFFQFDPPATPDKVRTLCGLDNVEKYLSSQCE